MKMIQKYYSHGIVSECCLGHFVYFWCGVPEFETELTQVHCSFRLTIRELWNTLNMHNSKHLLRSSTEDYGRKTH